MNAAAVAEGMLEATAAETARHSRQVQTLALRIADRLDLHGADRESVAMTARFHDVGKFQIPVEVLEKQGSLSPEEWTLMREHTILGENVLRASDELSAVAAYVRHSHERWDGDGYPDGLSGEGIPLISRIVFCADAFDSICSDRPYRKAAASGEALAEIRQCAGTQFDPRVVDALTDVIREDLPPRRRWPRRRDHASVSPRAPRRWSHSQLPVLAAVVTVGVLGSTGAAVTTGLRPLSPASDRSTASAPDNGAEGIGSATGGAGQVLGATASSETSSLREQPRRSSRAAGPQASLGTSGSSPPPAEPVEPATRLPSGRQPSENNPDDSLLGGILHQGDQADAQENSSATTVSVPPILPDPTP